MEVEAGDDKSNKEIAKRDILMKTLSSRYLCFL